MQFLRFLQQRTMLFTSFSHFLFGKNHWTMEMWQFSVHFFQGLSQNIACRSFHNYYLLICLIVKRFLLYSHWFCLLVTFSLALDAFRRGFSVFSWGKLLCYTIDFAVMGLWCLCSSSLARSVTVMPPDRMVCCCGSFFFDFPTQSFSQFVSFSSFPFLCVIYYS